MKNHIIITGTGRSGTTFLVQLLTELGLDTGFKTPYDLINELGKCGMEYSIDIKPTSPYIVKSPFFCFKIDQIIQDGYIIDHAIVPIRNVDDATKSRVRIFTETKSPVAPGSLWGTTDPSLQKDYLKTALGKLKESLTRHNISTTYLDFPRIVDDSNYLYDNLNEIFKIQDKQKFIQAFTKISKPELVHRSM